MISRLARILAPWLAVSLAACSVNPATGRRQLNLYSESQEIAIGRKADPEIVAQFGLYPDEDLQTYIDHLGQSMAAVSERPGLPWTFRVIDDPVVNAFALPGGFVYVTRGILAHMGTEAEIAGVIGHEIGHVTARHGVNQMTKAQLTQVGLAAGSLAAPQMAERFGGLAQSAAGVLFLKFGREDERQADALGFRYMSRIHEPPAALAEVFRTLGRVSAGSGRSLPAWQSTHPAPEDREQRIRGLLADLDPALLNAPAHGERYKNAIDGIVFGDDPRQGFFRGQTFYHPELAFQIAFPDGWETSNTRQAVIAVEPEKKALMVLTLADEGDLTDAEETFFSQDGFEEEGAWIDRQDLAGRQFRFLENDQERLRGGVAFATLGDHVYQLVAYARPDDWSRHAHAAETSVTSLRPLQDHRILRIKPRRIELVTLERTMTLEAFARAYPSTIDLETLARINQIDDPHTRLAAGTRIKRVVGQDPSRP